MANNKQSLNNFGKAGWGTILYCLLMFYFYVGMINDGTNVLAPTAAANIGVEPGTVIQTNGYAGMLAVIGFIIVGQINRRIGPRYTAGIFTIISGLAYIVCGNTTSIPVFPGTPLRIFLNREKKAAHSPSGISPRGLRKTEITSPLELT